MSLALVSTPEIEAFLAKALQCPGHEIPASQAQEGEVDWATLKAAAAGVRCGCPGPRDKRWTSKKYAEAAGSPSRLHANVRLEARRKAADQHAYDKLVEDVTGTEAKSRMHSQYLPTMKLQIGQGVHVAVTMGLGYALGSQFGAALSTSNPLMKPLGGVVGIMVALVFETTLFIVRANMAPDGGKKYMHLLDPKAAALAAAPATPAGEAFTTKPAPKTADATSKKNR